MRPFAIASLGLCAVLTVSGCEKPAAPAQYPPGQYDPGNPGQLNPGQFNQGQMNPGQLNPGPMNPPPQAIPQGPPVPNDPVSDVDLTWLRAAAGGVLSELVAALPQEARTKVQGVPFITDPAVGEVNAYAACDERHMPLMAMTDGILQIEAYIAQMRATDEVFGTQKLDGYLRYVAQNQRPKQPIVAPPPGFVDPMQHVDYRKVVRQHQLVEEQMAFVLGHELAHHHLGHTGCAVGESGDRKVTLADLLRLGQRIVPIANQPNEVSADVAGVNNLLSAGARRQGYHWTEGGALLTLDFFSRLDKLTTESLIFAFESSHPNPALRVPFVNQAAQNWRRNGGAGWQQQPMPQQPMR
ncbi:MAG: M48 family metalloprotease [Minicystis sp.]